MLIYDVFKEPSSEIPRKWLGPDFYKTVQKDLTDYMASINSLDLTVDAFSNHLNTIDLKSESQYICNQLISAISNYLDGHPSAAYQVLEDLLSLPKIALHFEKLFSVPLKIKDFDFYRVRDSGNYPLTKDNIFHVPLSRRFNVKTTRYSIPGFPCLYLGSTLYISVIENRQLDLSKLIGARFNLRKDDELRVLDFGHTNTTIDELLDLIKPRSHAPIASTPQATIDLITSLVLFFPVLMVSSYIVQHPQLDFKPEYIIPQLMLQYVRKSNGSGLKKIDGIRYFSSHINKQSSYRKNQNFVFPIRDSVIGSDHCTWLRSCFELTDPKEVSNLVKIDYINKTLFKMAHEAEDALKAFPLSYF